MPECGDLIKQVLGEDYTKIIVTNLKIKDDLQGTCYVTVKLFPNTVVEGSGVGQIDAIFSALKNYYAREYKSLTTIELIDLNVQLKHNTSKHRDGADAECSVTLILRNSRGNLSTFPNSSRSLATSSVRAVASAVEFFINSEKAFCILYRALENAKERNRQDLITKYTAELANITRNTSYKKIEML